MSALSSIITDSERVSLGAMLREQGLNDAADVIDNLVKFATDEIYLVDDLDRTLRSYVKADQAMHKVYGSTSVCYGGIGGSAMTEHCAHVCHNVSAHEKELDDYRNAYIAALEITGRVRRG